MKTFDDAIWQCSRRHHVLLKQCSANRVPFAKKGDEMQAVNRHLGKS
jgi:hypothetical protein